MNPGGFGEDTSVYDPSAPDDTTVSTPTVMANPGSNARYVYLLSRLRNRQITMEEATELFAIQQGMIRRAPSAPPSAPPTPPDTAATEDSATAVPPAPAATQPFAINDETFALALLAFGAGSGFLAAVAKKARNDLLGPLSPETAPASTSRK